MEVCVVGFCALRLYTRRIVAKVASQLVFNDDSEFCPVFDTRNHLTNNVPSNSTQLPIMEQIIDNGFLWGVPKKRRSLEVRWCRKMAANKLLVPKRNIMVCDVCGHFHLAHTVCGNCYEKVKEETKVMQEAIQQKLQLDPIEKDVIVIYENEERTKSELEGKIIVELPRKCPPWFSKNLLIKSNENAKRLHKNVGNYYQKPTIKNEE